MKAKRSWIASTIYSHAAMLIPLLVSVTQPSAASSIEQTAPDHNQKAKDERMREITEQAELAREIRLVDTDLKYAQAKQEYEKAKEKKRDLPGLIHATISYALACRNVRYPEKASRLYDEAIDAYFAMDLNSPAEAGCRKDLLMHMGLLSPESFQSKFPKFFKISEEKTSGKSVSEVDTALRMIPSEFRSMQYPSLPQFRKSTDAFDAAQFWKTAIDIRSAVRGSNSAELQPLLQNYASACESTNFPEAEKTYLSLAQLANKDDADSEANVQLDMAKLYLRHKMADKAMVAYKKAFELSKKHMSRHVVSQLLSVASDYNRQTQSAPQVDALSDLLALGGDEVVQEVDGSLGSKIDACINSFDLTKAQALLIKRLEASKTCSQDNQANRWRLKLSEVDLALGEEAESNRLFDQVKVTYALTNQNVDKLIEDRKKLIDALKSNKQASGKH